MDKYGLNPGTLKGELFSILLTQGNYGLEVSELAKSSSVSTYHIQNALQHPTGKKEGMYCNFRYLMVELSDFPFSGVDC